MEFSCHVIRTQAALWRGPSDKELSPPPNKQHYLCLAYEGATWEVAHAALVKHSKDHSPANILYATEPYLELSPPGFLAAETLIINVCCCKLLILGQISYAKIGNNTTLVNFSPIFRSLFISLSTEGQSLCLNSLLYP